jgi:hypothetical protein
MTTECSAALFGFAPVEAREVVAGFDGGTITSDAGGLLLGAVDHAVKLTKRFAARASMIGLNICNTASTWRMYRRA